MSSAPEVTKATEASEVPIDRQSDVDEKEQVDHIEAAPISEDPKVAALQAGIEALHGLTQEEYDALHKRLVRKVSFRVASDHLTARSIPDYFLCFSFSWSSIIWTEMPSRQSIFFLRLCQ